MAFWTPRRSRVCPREKRGAKAAARFRGPRSSPGRSRQHRGKRECRPQVFDQRRSGAAACPSGGMADTRDSKSRAGNGVRVRLSPRAFKQGKGFRRMAAPAAVVVVGGFSPLVPSLTGTTSKIPRPNSHRSITQKSEMATTDVRKRACVFDGLHDAPRAKCDGASQQQRALRRELPPGYRAHVREEHSYGPVCHIPKQVIGRYKPV